jgi:phospholipid/cholesterol/gamma-HCH transport system substrate-binding protein
METRANHVMIGLFVLVGMLAALAFVVWKSDASSGDRRAFVVLFDGPVRGLGASSDVLFNGLDVGKVRSLRISPTDSRKVEALVWLEPGTPVRTNSHASIVQTGLTGLAAVQISPGTPDAAMVEGAKSAPFPRIDADPATASGSLLEAMPELVANANAAFQRVNTLVADNQDAIRATVTSVERFAKVLDDKRTDIASIIDNAKTFSDAGNDMKKLLATADAAIARIDGLVARSGPALTSTLDNAALVSATLAERRDDIAATLVQARALSETVQGLSKKLERTLDEASGLMSGTDNRSLAVEIKTTVASFRTLAENLERSLNGADGLTGQGKRSLAAFERFMREGAKAAATADRTMDGFERDPQKLLFGGKKVPEYVPQ